MAFATKVMLGVFNRGEVAVGNVAFVENDLLPVPGDGFMGDCDGFFAAVDVTLRPFRRPGRG